MEEELVIKLKKVVLPEKIEQISATKIRAKLRKEGKLEIVIYNLKLIISL